MVKRGLLLLALVAGVVGLRAGFLPLQLDPPKHDNPVDPLNPKNLAHLFDTPTPAATSTAGPTATASPTSTPSPTASPSRTDSPVVPPTASPTPVLPQLISELPLNNATVNIPFVSGPVGLGNAGKWELTLRFNMDMDVTTFSQAGAVVFSPPADAVLTGATARSATYTLNTTNSGGIHPLAVGTAYTVSVGSAIHAATGVPLVPATLNYTTGPFALAVLLTGNSFADGVLYGSVVNEPPANWKPLIGAVFNAPLDTSVFPTNQVQCSPNVIVDESYQNIGNISDVNQLSLNLCGVLPNATYTFSYTGGIKDRNGNVAAPVSNLVRVAEPIRVVGYSCPPDTQYLVVNFNYSIDTVSGPSAFTISPPPPYPLTFVNPGCQPNSTPGNSVSPGYAYVYSGGQSFVSGVTYTASITTGLQDLGDTANLSTPWRIPSISPKSPHKFVAYGGILVKGGLP